MASDGFPPGDILLRLLEERESFIYTVVCNGNVRETGEVPVADLLSEEYYGGSQALD